MGERFDTSRPIYAQIVERLKAKILWRASTRPADIWTRCATWPQRPGSTPTPCSGRWPSWKRKGLVYTERTTGRFVTEDTALLEQLRDETASAMTTEYLEKMRGIGYGPAEAAKLMTGWETKESD